jgi:hypothetical protein
MAGPDDMPKRWGLARLSVQAFGISASNVTLLIKAQ